MASDLARKTAMRIAHVVWEKYDFDVELTERFVSIIDSALREQSPIIMAETPEIPLEFEDALRRVLACDIPGAVIEVPEGFCVWFAQLDKCRKV